MQTRSVVASIADWTVEGMATILLILWAPVEAAIRANRRVDQSRRMAALRREYELTAYEMRLAAQHSVDFLRTFLSRHAELQRRIRQYPDVRTPHDAGVVIGIYELAERQLIEEAKRAADVTR